MIVLAAVEDDQKVLEVGSGSGWTATLLSFIVKDGEIVSIERIPELLKKAQYNHYTFLHSLDDDQRKQYSRVRFSTKNFFDQPIDEEFDRIIFTAGITEKLLPALRKHALDLLKDGGKLVCPYISGPMLKLTKQGKILNEESTQEQYVFVPLVREVY